MEHLSGYQSFLRDAEKSDLTVEKYLRDVGAFLRWLGPRELEKRAVLEYKAYLTERYAPASVNSMLSALNSYFLFLGRMDCKVRILRQQRRIFCSEQKELTRGEYQRLLQAAAGQPRLHLLIQTICATGIRVSEHRFITAEAVRAGVAEVYCKGKLRTVLLPRKLCAALRRYARAQGIRTGSLFVTRRGKPLDRSYIWAEMKKLCKAANVLAEKVFPHNLRHLFARTYYAMEKDIVRLADILGHASINTTRIYTVESGETHRRQIEKMRLICIT